MLYSNLSVAFTWILRKLNKKNMFGIGVKCDYGKSIPFVLRISYQVMSSIPLLKSEF